MSILNDQEPPEEKSALAKGVTALVVVVFSIGVIWTLYSIYRDQNTKLFGSIILGILVFAGFRLIKRFGG